MVNKGKKEKNKAARSRQRQPVHQYIQPEQKPLTANEAADYLRVSSKTLTGLLANGQIPARRVGRQWRILKHALDRWLTGEIPEGA